MANFHHLKAPRTRVLDRFPTKEFGNDGDIVISRISGRGVFICSKAGGMWYVANQMQELNRIGKATLKDITTSKLRITDIANTEKPSDKYIVSESGNIQYKTGKQVANDLPLPINNISYKQAYCSLERYTDQETCEANGGTWYYSENDTHDSIGSTAENQLLTIGQIVGSVDAEPTLLYDGSVLEIKRNTNFDDNWQTAANDNVLKLSYNSTVSSTLGTDSNGNLKITASNTVLSGTLEISTIATDTAGDNYLVEVSGVVKKRTPAETLADIGAQATVTAGTNCTFAGATLNVDDSFITNDADDTMAGALTIDKDTTATTTGNTYGLNIDYDHTGICASGQSIRNYGISLAINSDSPTHVGSVLNFGIDNTVTAGTSGTQSSIGINNIVTGADTNTGIYQKVTDGGTDLKFVSSANIGNYFSIATTADGATTIATVDSNASAGHLTLQPDGDLKVIPNTGISTFFRGANTDDYFSIAVDGSGGAILSTTDAASNEAHLTFDVDGDIRLDSHTGNFIAKAAGTEFSADNSAYAGMILGYTRLEGDLTNQSTFEIQNSMTVEDSTHKITFKTPPSENVEIFASFCVDISSTDTEINVGLSDNATYNSVGQKFEYDNRGVFFSDDEANDIVSSAKWVLQASELADVGSSNTFYIGFSTSGATKTAYLRYGLRASHNITDHPFIIKATALPETIYDGS